jgi:hypothetical protein
MNKVALALIYAGLLPFIVCAFCLAGEVSQLPFLGETRQILATYSLIIISFIAGSYWGQQLVAQHGTWVLVLSNLITLTAWFGFLILSFNYLIILLILMFLILLLVDSKLLEKNVITSAYFQTRCWVTIIVVIALVSSII